MLDQNLLRLGVLPFQYFVFQRNALAGNTNQIISQFVDVLSPDPNLLLVLILVIFVKLVLIHVHIGDLDPAAFGLD